MSPDVIKNLKQPESQDRNVFNAYKRTLKELKNFTTQQLASLHFETWHEVKQRQSTED